MFTGMNPWQTVVLVAIVAFVVLEVVGMITRTLQAKYPQITEDTIYKSILGVIQAASEDGGGINVKYRDGEMSVTWYSARGKNGRETGKTVERHGED